MHPDALIAGLRRELERFPERAAEIEAEIARVDRLPRPAASPEAPETTVDHRIGYLAGLEKELARAGEERGDEIRAEIARVKAELRSGSTQRATAEPKAEQATAEPKPTTPDTGKTKE